MMPAFSSRSDVRLDVGLGESPDPSTSEPDALFRMAVFGDFSGRASRHLVRTGPELSSLRPIPIDRDNCDDVMAELDVRLQLPEAGDIRIAEIEGFHPDRLYLDVPFFAKVRKAAQELLSLPASRITIPVRRPRTPTPKVESGSLLDHAVEATERGATGAPPTRQDDLQVWLEGQVAPHLVPKADQRVTQLRAVVAETAAAQMRAVLHYPSFQRLEALWRSLDLLVRRVETSSTLTIHLIDVSKQEIAADLSAVPDPRDSAVGRLLADSSAEAPYAVLLGAYGFAAKEEDLRLLARLGAIAAAAGAPWISDADPTLAGCSSLASEPDPAGWISEPDPRWQALRRLPVAAWLGLVMPRLLLRLPYGRETDSCETLAFEEMEGNPEHDRYLWGSSAFASGCLLASSFADRGWRFRPGEHLDFEGLPLHAHSIDGEPRVQSPSEVWLTEGAAERALERGLMPLVARRNTDSVRLARFQSIADPPAPLAGRWGRA